MDKILGYYTVGDKEFFSKIQACVYATETNQEINWVFNNKQYYSFNWEAEPEESLDELYNKRARELREEYDYICISYSGGADSNNVFMSFYRQGLHVDELIINTMEKINSKYTIISPENKNAENYSAEHYLQTIPRLKEIANNCPLTKITIMDMSDNLIEIMSSSQDGEWIMSRREIANPVGTSRYNLLFINSLRKKFDRDKKIAVIFGIDKPVTWLKDKELYLILSDKTANYGVAEHIAEYDNVTIEYFYLHPNALKIQSKQAHTIKKWLEVFPQYQRIWETLNKENFVLIQERLLRTIIYTTWNNDWYQADKPILDWRTEFANSFFKEFQGTMILGEWQKGIQYLRTRAHKYLAKPNKFGQIDGLAPMNKFFKIGKLK